MNENWKRIGSLNEFPEDLGSCVKLADEQIAVFRIATNTESEEWYAIQNFNPINRRMVLSRGIVGSTEEHGPKVACPLHKHNFSLKDGTFLDDDSIALKTYPVKIEGNEVFIHFPN